MATVIGDTYPYPLESAHRRRIEIEYAVTLNASGAVGALVSSDDPGVTLTRTGVGTYNVVFPAGADVGGKIDAVVLPSTGALRGTYFTAFNATAGTATVVTLNAAGAAADSAGGDVLRIQAFLNSRKDF